jgi:hypothetical protein
MRSWRHWGCIINQKSILKERNMVLRAHDTESCCQSGMAFPGPAW